MADYSVSDIAILRKNERQTSSDDDDLAARPVAARAPRKTTVAKTPNKIPKQKKDVDVDERFRQVTAVLLHAGLVDVEQKMARGIVVTSGRVR